MAPRTRQLAHRIGEILDIMAQLTVSAFAGMVMEKSEVNSRMSLPRSGWCR